MLSQRFCKGLIGFLLVSCLSACRDSGDKKAEVSAPNDSSSSSTSAESNKAGTADASLAGMVGGIVEQAEKQGTKIDLAQNREALIQVIKLYLVRPDLQQAYGGPASVDLSGLVAWANASGTAGDADKQKLAPYAAVLAPLAEQLSKNPIRVKLEWR